MASINRHLMDILRFKYGPILLTAMVLVMVPIVDSLLCYQCAHGAKDGGECKNDINGLVKSSVGDPEKDITPEDGIYTKNCTSNNANNSLEYCVIETFQTSGVSKSYIRDCSDGRTFSYSGELILAKLDSVEPNNETTCIYRLTANFHICVTLCKTDFCNGPIPIAANNTNCTEDGNTTCAASRPMWVVNGPLGFLIFHPFVLPIIIYILSIMFLS